MAPFSSNSTLHVKDFLLPLSKAASCKSYIETFSDKADSLHRLVEKQYEESFTDAFFTIMKPFLKQYKHVPVTLAFDITDEPFYGKTRNMWIHNYTGKDGIVGKLKYLTLSLVGKEKLPVLALPFHVGQDMTDAIRFLFEKARSVCKHIRLVLFDRGFYSGSLLAYLQEQNITFLMFVPKNKRMQRYWQEQQDTMLHTITYRDGNTRKHVCVKHVFVTYDKLQRTFATNLCLRKSVNYIFAYKQRWQIETNFRVQDEAKIKSKSCHYLTRYFYFLMSLLLQCLWRIFSTKPFMRFVSELSDYFFLQSLGISYAPSA